MPVYTVVGIDPGLNDTGVVLLQFSSTQMLTIRYAVVAGIDGHRIEMWLRQHGGADRIFIEKYRPRSNFGTDERMVKGEAELKLTFPKAELLDNTGVRKVVGQKVLEMLDCWDFDTRTSHQDLRSAARIAVLGMLKDEELNTVLADVARAYLDGSPWLTVNKGGTVV